MTAPLLAALLLAAPSGAQNRAGAVDAVAVAPVTGLGGALGSAPQAVTLNLAAPTLSMVGPVTPALAPSAAAPLAAPALTVAPAAFAPAAAPVAAPVLVPLRKTMAEAAPEGTEKLDDAAMIRLTKRLFGEDAGEDAGLAAYLRPDRPFAFGAKESADYRAARAPADRAVAAAALLRSAGVAVEERDGKVRVLPVKDGSPLNRLAEDLRRAHGAAVVYDPGRLGDSGVAAFNHKENTLFLPHFGHPKSYAAVLHESHHSNYAARQTRGDLSPFHASLVAKNGAVVPGVVYYAGYMSLEELTAHAKTLKHLLAAARRSGDAAKRWEIEAEVVKTMDVRRSASITLARVLRQLDEGAAVEPVPDGHWVLAELGPVGGGRWHQLSLPWSTLYLPVLDEPAPAPKTGLARLFSKKPPTPGQRAARATAAVTLAYLRETDALLDGLRDGLWSEALDWEALNALADRLSLAGPRAEKAFESARLPAWTPARR
ncbi:MAG: hypothetical protein HY079_02735 [Elusimicrobia bacterium]|nr:hypothetical protein [Elusimicrobiota bacterium]